MRLTRAALDPYTGMVVFDVPKHDAPTSAIVEVSFDNGETYTNSGKFYTYYAEPLISGIRPSCRLSSGEAVHYLQGAGLEGAGQYTKVRFTAEGQEAVVTAGEWSDEHQAVACKSPPFPKGNVTVEVALNGQQYSPHTATLVYFEPPEILALSPDCLAFGQSCDVAIKCSNALEGLKVRLRGDCFPGGVVLDSFGLERETSDPDVGTVLITAPAATTLGVANVELSVDGEEWIRSPAKGNLHVFGPLQPELRYKNSFAGGGSVNALADPSLFPGTCFTVRIGDDTHVPGAYLAGSNAVVFTMPPYDPKTMGSDPLAVGSWLHPQGPNAPGVSALAYTIAY